MKLQCKFKISDKLPPTNKGKKTCMTADHIKLLAFHHFYFDQPESIMQKKWKHDKLKDN